MQTLSVSICAQFALSTTPAQAGQHSSHFVMTIPAAADPGWTLELGRDGGSSVMDRFIVPRLKIP